MDISLLKRIVGFFFSKGIYGESSWQVNDGDVDVPKLRVTVEYCLCILHDDHRGIEEGVCDLEVSR